VVGEVDEDIDPVALDERRGLASDCLAMMRQ
jgi:hypothetical protein